MLGSPSRASIRRSQRPKDVRQLPLVPRLPRPLRVLTRRRFARGSRPLNFGIASWPLLTCHSRVTSTEPAHPSRGHFGGCFTAPPNTRADCVPSAPREDRSPRDAVTPRASLSAVRTALRLSALRFSVARGLPLDHASAALATRTGKQKYRASHGVGFRQRITNDSDNE